MALNREKELLGRPTLSLPVPLLHFLTSALFCLALAGVADPAAAAEPVVGWGGNANDQATPPNEVNGVSGTAIAISTGANHTCAIQAGTDNCVCWGNGNSGQATPPDEANGVWGTATEVAAGGFHTLAIVALPEPSALLAQLAGAALLGPLHRSRARERKG